MVGTATIFLDDEEKEGFLVIPAQKAREIFEAISRIKPHENVDQKIAEILRDMLEREIKEKATELLTGIVPQIIHASKHTAQQWIDNISTHRVKSTYFYQTFTSRKARN